jgi:methylated-DNA-[protein]-cysteine S-methyltransferase
MPQKCIDTKVGPVLIEGDGTAIARIRIGERGQDASDALVDEAAAQILAYFAGTRETFDIPLLPAATERGQILRDAIAGIGFGRTMSYGALAHEAGSAPRAIGQACARNPFPILIPCRGQGHRSLFRRRRHSHQAQAARARSGRQDMGIMITEHQA